MTKVIVPVGTSIFTNYMEKRSDIAEHWDNIKEMPASEYNACKDRIIRIKEVFSKVKLDTNASAEIKSIEKIKQELKESLEIKLIASDSVSSIVAAEILVSKLLIINSVSFENDKDVIKGLLVSNRKLFEKEGMPNLIHRIEEICGSYYENTVINITGGFKATIPYLTLLGQVNNIPLYYIFEDTDELIKIPQAPVDINWGLFEKYAHVFRGLEKGIYDWRAYKWQSNIGADFQECIWEDSENDLAELNAVGRIFWNRYKTYFLVNILKQSDYFDLNQGEKKQVNKALIELYKKLKAFIDENNLIQEPVKEIYKKIRQLGEQHDLRHGPTMDNQTFIFKSTDIHQTRLAYSFDLINQELSLRIYFCKTGGFQHENYMDEFKERFDSIKSHDIEFINISMKKS